MLWPFSAALHVKRFHVNRLTQIIVVISFKIYKHVYGLTDRQLQSLSN